MIQQLDLQAPCSGIVFTLKNHAICFHLKGFNCVKTSVLGQLNVGGQDTLFEVALAGVQFYRVQVVTVINSSSRTALVVD
jgi:hypothetical protein